jgi:hypothetical protein
MKIELMIDEMADAIMAEAKKMKKKDLLDLLSEMVNDNLFNMSDEAIIDTYNEMKGQV